MILVFQFLNQNKSDKLVGKKIVIDKKVTKRIWQPQAVVSVMLLWALYPGNPYGYYTLLRLVCCGIFAYLAVQAIILKMQGWTWVLGITAVVYNPIIPIHLTRGIWSVVNIVTIGIAVVSIFAIPLRRNK